MNVVVLGAAGRSGRLIVAEALRAGHHVTAAVRNPSSFEPAPGLRVEQAAIRDSSDVEPAAGLPAEQAAIRDSSDVEPAAGLRVERADVRDADSLRAVLRGQDAVVCAIGAPGRKAENLYSDAARALVPAMAATGVTRLLAITSVGVRHDDPHHAWWYRGLIRPIGADLYADMARMEDIVRGSDLDWTFVRPTYLRDSEPTGSYRATHDSTPEGGWRVTRADVARFIVEELTAHRWSRRAPSLAQ